MWPESGHADNTDTLACPFEFVLMGFHCTVIQFYDNFITYNTSIIRGSKDKVMYMQDFRCTSTVLFKPC